ncbi:DUF6773 family protein [Sedimentibacter sp. B4]|uniref:DUF6773 family protein n=1 Tax=Sedimentibacter sp. B4 TaxID=304766 RepID=UPI000310DBFB|nr:DUF6773 family protein [Sedimentibacter sp. B4]
MKKDNIQDERIVSQKRKIGSDAFGIVFYGLLISILIQQYMFDAPFSQYAAEFILFMVSAIYVVGRNIIVGNNLFSNSFKGQKMVVINSVVCGLTIAVITTTFNTMNYGYEKMGGASLIAITAFITFFCGALTSFIGFEILYILNKKRQKQIDDMYNDSDE